MARIRYTKSVDWFDIWECDKQSVLDTMIRNMTADLDAGYDYFGQCIINQREMIANYKAKIDSAYDEFKYMDEDEVNRWCFYDLKKRGAIE